MLACFLYVPTHNVSLPHHNFIEAGLTMHYVFGGKSICYITLLLGLPLHSGWVTLPAL